MSHCDSGSTTEAVKERLHTMASIRIRAQAIQDFFNREEMMSLSPAVNLMLSIAVYATPSPSCSPPHGLRSVVLTDHVLCCGPSGLTCALVNLHSIVDIRLKSRPAAFCVESQGLHAFVNSSSVRVENVDLQHLQFFSP